MDKQEIMEKITSKKEFSNLPSEDVERAYLVFDYERYTDEEKVKLTRDLLRKVYSVFASGKLMNLKDKDEEWILKKHISTRERFGHYDEIYSRIFEGLTKIRGAERINVFDLGAGVNGFSYLFLRIGGYNINYTGVEALGQLVNLMNFYFKKNKMKNAVAMQESLFNLEDIKDIIKKREGIKVIFLFKVLDSLEMLERDYSKKILNEITPISDRVVVSFATRSLVKRQKFNVNRNWIINFIGENFDILDDFEIGSERYVVFGKR